MAEEAPKYQVTGAAGAELVKLRAKMQLHVASQHVPAAASPAGSSAPAGGGDQALRHVQNQNVAPNGRTTADAALTPQQARGKGIPVPPKGRGRSL
jgi:hypothetical protein